MGRTIPWRGKGEGGWACLHRARVWGWAHGVSPLGQNTRRLRFSFFVEKSCILPRAASVSEGGGLSFSFLTPEYRRNVFFIYEKRLRVHSPPEKVVEYFSSGLHSSRFQLNVSTICPCDGVLGWFQ